MNQRSRVLWTVGVMLAALSLIFTALVCVVDVQPIGPEGSRVGFAGINGALNQRLGYRHGWYTISKVLGILALLTAAGFAVLGLVQLIRERDLRKVDPRILALAGLYAAVLVLYVLFDKLALNVRPLVLDKGLEPSYPSTHTLLGCCLFGSAGLVLSREPIDRRLALGCKVLFWILALLTVLSRLLSGVHWFTDILGGLLISGTLLTFFAAALAALSERRPVQEKYNPAP